MKKRELNIDLLRCIAVISILSVHFFLNSGFYKLDIMGKRLFAMTTLRTSFMVCVPLFLIITGYLMNKKTMNRKYYIGICYTLGTYLIISLFCCLFKVLFLHEKLVIKDIIVNILKFKGAPYAWYIEMYVGLYILIPFLNILYQNIGDKKKKQLLLVSIGAIVTLPTLINMYRGIQIIPDWWINIWPLLYYFVGCYIKEYDIKISIKTNVIALIAIILVSGGVNFYLSHNNHFLWKNYNRWYGWQNVCSSILLFILIKNLNLSKIPNFLNKIITFIAKISLGIYLSSWILDSILYERLKLLIPNVVKRMDYFIVIVPLVFVGSALLSILSEVIYKCCSCVCYKLYYSCKKIENKN